MKEKSDKGKNANHIFHPFGLRLSDTRGLVMKGLVKNMKNRISGIINLFISGFLLIAIHTFLKPCQGAMKMSCNYSTKAADLVLILILVINIGKLFVEDFKGALFLDITTIAGAVELLFVPHIGRCKMASMSCNAKTFPALRVGALLLIAITVAFAAVNWLGSRRAENVDSE